ncbi:uncharacterized protein [Diabrotica undecimpunctata]|uniref:uncharacterized protein n=1 Tax=Diabrotica undecimpunctata TaxID=50387 RepID=UPI003B639AD4
MRIPGEILCDLTKFKLKNVCRICITGKRYMRNIYRTKIPKMLKACYLSEISENDGLPNKICGNCILAITKIYNFKKNVEHNTRILREIVLNEKNIFSHNRIVGNDVNNENFDISLDQSVTEKPYCIEDLPILINNPLHLTSDKSESLTSVSTDSFQIYTEDVPPLIPIWDDNKSGSADNLFQDLPQDAPPLVPIKNPHIKRLVNVIPKLEYKCFICSEKFQDVTYLKEHTIKCKSKNFQCSICQKTFSERKKLISHLKGHKTVKDHLCKICSKKYANPSTFRIHMMSHTGERPFKCNICSKGFVRWAEVKLHMNTHEDKRPFSCDICQKAFKSRSNLERHKRIHLGIEPYSCTYCPKSYKQLVNLTAHIRTYHTNERPFLCNICGKGYITSSRLNRHMLSHSEHKQFKCKVCPKSYANYTDLLSHECYHQGKNVDDLKKYSCDKCSLKFFYRCRLVKHQKTHEKTAESNICSKELSRHLILDHSISLSTENATVNDEEIVVAKNTTIYSLTA